MMDSANNTFEIDSDAWEPRQDRRLGASRLALRTFTSLTPGIGSEATFLRRIEDFVHTIPDYLSEVARPDPPTWLEDVYSLVVREAHEDATDLLFERIDDLFVNSEFHRCNELLQIVDLKRLDTYLLVGLLSVTLSAAAELPYRARLVAKVERRLRELAPDRIDGLLSGLR